MADQKRRAGTIYFKVDGIAYDAKGNFSYNLGMPKREAIVGADGIHGYTEKPQVPYIEGEITDSGSLSLSDLASITNSTVTLDLANGKTITGSQMWFAADGKGQTEEGNIEVRFEAENQLKEVK